MKQSRGASFLESTLSTAAGFSISLAAQWFFLPLLGVAISLTQNVIFAVIMTVISIGRGYLLRRLFEFFHIRHPISPFMAAVIAERRRQIEVEGWDAGHDDAHERGVLAMAGAAYANHAAVFYDEGARKQKVPPPTWPWEADWWKPDSFRRDLVKAGALVVAEGEKCDRHKQRKRIYKFPANEKAA